MKEIETHEELHLKKIEIIKEIIKAFRKELSQIQAPVIDYSSMLAKICESLARFDEGIGGGEDKLADGITLRKVHYVCHFCGIIMDNNTINTMCKKNQLNELVKAPEDKCNFCKPGHDPSTVDKSGYCAEAPVVAKFGTHRHYFGEPADPNLFYKVAFLRWVAGSASFSSLLSFLP